MVTVTQAVDLSLTESLSPFVVHAKQYDSIERQLSCSIYREGVLVVLDSDVIVSGVGPDGEKFYYSSKTDPDTVYIEDNNAVIRITDTMTCAPGRMPVDVTIVDDSGSSVGAFSFILSVERAAVGNRTLSTASYNGLLSMLGVFYGYINDDGYVCILSSDDTGLSSDTDGNVIIDNTAFVKALYDNDRLVIVDSSGCMLVPTEAYMSAYSGDEINSFVSGVIT